MLNEVGVEIDPATTAIAEQDAQPLELSQDDVAAPPGALVQDTEGASQQQADDGEKGAEGESEMSLEEKFKKWLPEVSSYLHDIMKAIMMIMMMMINDDAWGARGG